jgi:hypothetical protein
LLLNLAGKIQRFISVDEDHKEFCKSPKNNIISFKSERVSGVIVISNYFKNIRLKMSNKFICKECGCEELVFTIYAKCLIPVLIREDGNLEYLEPIVNSDDYMDNTDYFCCYDCGSHVGDSTNCLHTEQELLKYLSSQVVRQNEMLEILGEYYL